jgi:hypothetical protein
MGNFDLHSQKVLVEWCRIALWTISTAHALSSQLWLENGDFCEFLLVFAKFAENGHSVPIAASSNQELSIWSKVLFCTTQWVLFHYEDQNFPQSLQEKLISNSSEKSIISLELPFMVICYDIGISFFPSYFHYKLFGVVCMPEDREPQTPTLFESLSKYT